MIGGEFHRLRNFIHCYRDSYHIRRVLWRWILMSPRPSAFSLIDIVNYTRPGWHNEFTSITPSSYSIVHPSFSYVRPPSTPLSTYHSYKIGWWIIELFWMSKFRSQENYDYWSESGKCSDSLRVSLKEPWLFILYSRLHSRSALKFLHSKFREFKDSTHTMLRNLILSHFHS